MTGGPSSRSAERPCGPCVGRPAPSSRTGWDRLPACLLPCSRLRAATGRSPAARCRCGRTFCDDRITNRHPSWNRLIGFSPLLEAACACGAGGGFRVQDVASGLRAGRRVQGSGFRVGRAFRPPVCHGGACPERSRMVSSALGGTVTSRTHGSRAERRVRLAAPTWMDAPANENAA